MEQPYEQYADLLKALAHPTRLEILDMLRVGEICVCHIEAALGKRQAYISQQLMTLREAGIVESRRDGLQVYYRLVDERVVQVLATMLGAAVPEHYQQIAGCPCPECTVIPITEIR